MAADFDDGCHCCGNGCDVLVFNTTFWKILYFHKEKELKSSFDQVRLICEKQGDSSDDAYVQFEKICANGNINMLIADQDRNLIWSSYSSAQRFQMQMEDWLYGSDRSRVQVLSSGKDYTLLRQTDERLQSEYLVLLGTLKMETIFTCVRLWKAFGKVRA